MTPALVFFSPLKQAFRKVTWRKRRARSAWRHIHLRRDERSRVPSAIGDAAASAWSSTWSPPWKRRTACGATWRGTVLSYPLARPACSTTSACGTTTPACCLNAKKGSCRRRCRTWSSTARSRPWSGRLPILENAYGVAGSDWASAGQRLAAPAPGVPPRPSRPVEARRLPHGGVPRLPGTAEAGSARCTYAPVPPAQGGT